jgi:hypothetical protein
MSEAVTSARDERALEIGRRIYRMRPATILDKARIRRRVAEAGAQEVASADLRAMLSGLARQVASRSAEPAVHDIANAVEELEQAEDVLSRMIGPGPEADAAEAAVAAAGRRVAGLDMAMRSSSEAYRALAAAAEFYREVLMIETVRALTIAIGEDAAASAEGLSDAQLDTIPDSDWPRLSALAAALLGVGRETEKK